MEPVSKNIEFILGELSTKADMQVAGVMRIEKNLDDLGGRVGNVEREGIARDNALAQRVAALEAGGSHRKESLALIFSLLSGAGVIVTALKAFGVL